MKKFLKKYKIQLRLLLALTIGLVVLATIYYFLIPMVLNYPKDTYATDFQTEVENTNYFLQVVSISAAIFAIFAISTFYKTHFLVKYSDLIENPKKYKMSEINYVKNKLFTVPYSLFAINITIPSIALTAIHAYTIHQFGITTLKLFILVVSIMTLYVTAVFIYTNNLFRKILLKLPYDNTDGLKKYTLKKRIFYNILPLLFVSMLFLCLLGYTKVAIETGNSSFSSYSKDLYYFLNYNTFSDKNDILEKSKSLSFLKNSDYFFVKTPDGKFFDSDNKEIEFSRFFNLYLDEMIGIISEFPDLDYELVAEGGTCFNDIRQCRLPHIISDTEHVLTCRSGCVLFDGNQNPVKGKMIAEHPCRVAEVIGIYMAAGIHSFKIEGRTVPAVERVQVIRDLKREINRFLGGKPLNSYLHYISRMRREII